MPDRRGRIPPRLVDWTLLLLVAVAAVTGVASLGAGHPALAPLFDVHALAGLALVAVLAVKLRRVAPRITTASARDRATAVSVLLAVVALAALATGAFWSFGGNVAVLRWTTLNVHVGLGLLVVPLLLAHLLARARRPRAADLDPGSRRAALRYLGLLLAGAVAHRAQSAVRALGDLAADRRFTGSRPAGELYDGTDFPVTSWVADDPAPVDVDEWALRVDGLVGTPATVEYGTLAAAGDERTALLDCTSGWYTERRWRGVRLGSLLDSVGVADDAAWVVVRSVTGYRWSFPLAEARGMLLATHVDGDPLSHGHGAPLRLVAPDRRGFQWVKWVVEVRVTRRRDASQYLATLVSGLGPPRRS
jgi:DMSO/TMAO reductase YedYZ molybdopterin-dependent catalytic subunit